MKRTLILLLTIILFLKINIFAQLEQFQGMTREQIKARADSLGYTEEDLLKLQQSRQASKQKQQGEASSLNQKTVVIAPPVAHAPSNYTVAAFSGRVNADTLSAFGYSIFNYSPTSFESAINVPTPTNYVLGPGDELILTLWGETQLVHDLTVSKDGDIYIPEIGLVNVNGLSFNELKTNLFNRLSQSYSSLSNGKTHFSISTGELRSVQVYVLGEVNKPGGYTLPALSSAFTALYYCGGPAINGSLRKVKILRGGNVVSEIDLYNYLLNGDKSKDIKLQDEDIIFIPPVNRRVAVAGSIFHPAIYELKEGEILKDLLKFAGGVDFNAYYQRVHIERIIPFNQRKDYTNNILSLDLNFSTVDLLNNSNYVLDDGDVVNISGINMLPQNRVVINGDVRKPGVYELLGADMTVRDLIFKADSLFSDAFLDKAVLIRTLPSEKKEFIGIDLNKVLTGDPSDNLNLENRDSIQIYKQDSFYPTRGIEIYGQVKNPGRYIRYNEMTLTGLIVLAGGITDSATTKNIEVVRMDTLSAEVYAQKFTVNLPYDYWNVNKVDDFKLQDNDHVFIRTDTTKNLEGFVRTDSAKTLEGVVNITGEVQFPGSYSILYRGEKLSDFIKRAGGFTETAYTKGIFLRRANPVLSILQKIQLPDTMLLKNYNGRPIYDPAKFQAEFSNRVPIDWNDIKDDPESIYNIELQQGDQLFVPKDTRTISVVGDVNLPSTVPYKKGAGVSYYIKQAGGFTQTSYEGDEIVILPNGAKWSPSGLFFIHNSEILSGSTIFVPSYIESNTNDTWPVIRDIVTVVTSAAVLLFTIKNYK
ncbi:MAG: SLBB domain-containing protein [Ignavibacteriaceae bacterium]